MISNIVNMSQAKFKYYRVYFGVISVFVLVLMIAGLAKIWFYFNSGADRSSILNVPAILPETHVPKIKWLEDDAQTGREMEEYSRQTIMRDYIRGWYAQNISYMRGEPTGLKEYFTPAALTKVIHELKQIEKSDVQLQQTDIQHHIKLHYYSADGQIVSFTDKQLLLKQRIYSKETGKKVFNCDVLADYDVIMYLEDGYWRVKNWSRKKPTQLQADSIIIEKDKMVQVKNQDFYLNNAPFIPKGVNYYPQKTPWSFFWTRYNSSTIKTDFALIHQIGFNTIRIFVNFNDFNKGNVPPERLAQLKDLLDLAQNNNLKVIVTLFDYVGDYHLINMTSTDRQLETLLTTFKKHEAILAWDLKNEPDLDFKSQDPEDVKDWLKWSIRQAKIYDPNHLITVGWAYPENAHLLNENLDFVSFHSYKSPEELATGIETLKSKVNNKPLVLEEFGLSTYRGLWAPMGSSETDQADYFAKVKAILQQKGNIPSVVWTLYDFTEVPENVVGKMPWNRNPQKNFGLITGQGKIKVGTKILVQ